MAIVSKDLNKKQVIDLTGPEGNAYFLLGYGKKLSKVYQMLIGIIFRKR